VQRACLPSSILGFHLNSYLLLLGVLGVLGGSIIVLVFSWRAWRFSS